MRRILAAAMLGAALFAAAACGNNNNNNDDGGDDPATETSPTAAAGGTEDTCAAIDEAMGDFQTDLTTAGLELSVAAESGDQAAIDEATNNLLTVAGDTGERLRDIATQSDDPELRTAVEDAAVEVETLAQGLAADPESLETLDMSGFNEAAAAVEARCG